MKAFKHSTLSHKVILDCFSEQEIQMLKNIQAGLDRLRQKNDDWAYYLLTGQYDKVPDMDDEEDDE